MDVVVQVTEYVPSILFTCRCSQSMLLRTVSVMASSEIIDPGKGDHMSPALTIAVAVKHVPVGGAFLRVERDHLTREGVSHGIDPLNEVAMEWALQLRESGEAERVVAITMGPPAAADTLRGALALGADEAVLITDPNLVGADVRVTARALAAATAHVDAGLLVLGYESVDGSSGAVPAAVSAVSGWPLVSRVAEGSCADGTLTATRNLGTGPVTVEVEVPVVVSMVEGHVTPRFPKLKDVARTRNSEPTTLSGRDLEIDVPQVGERVVDLREVAQSAGEPVVLDLEAGIQELLARMIGEGSRG